MRGDFKTQRLSDMKIYCIRLPLVIGDLMGHRPQTERLTSGEQPLDHEVKVGDRGIKQRTATSPSTAMPEPPPSV